MNRRKLLISSSLLVSALLLAVLGAIFYPNSHELIVPIDRSVLDALKAEAKSEAMAKSDDTSKPTPLSPAQDIDPSVRSLALKPAPDPRLIEKTPVGLLPRKADNGDSPAVIYARPFDAVRQNSNLPSIAVVITQSGISETMTAEANLALPAEVSFSVSPYAQDADRQIRNIRNRGHEVYLDVPSTAENSAHEDRGPYALDPAQDAVKNRERLHKMMSRFTGYVGLLNDISPSFAQSAPLRDMVRNEAVQRGLYVFGFIRPHSGAFTPMTDPASERATPIPILLPGSNPADLTLALQVLLQRLSEEGGRGGRYVAVIDPSPLALDVLKAWIVKYQSSEFDLVPLSVLMRKEGQG